jgi:carbon-monoxide dehydrogenase large subunit
LILPEPYSHLANAGAVDSRLLRPAPGLVQRDESAAGGPGFLEEITYDESGNIQGGSFMDYLLPTAMETPKWETDKTTTPSPHHPFGAKGVGESATVGAPPAIANAVVDALSHLGVKHIDIPITPEKVWKILKEKGVAE